MTAWIFSGALTALILLWQIRRRRDFAARFRPLAEAAFLRQMPDCAGLTVVSEKEEIESSRGALLAYVLTRIARTPAGEHYFFMFRSDGTTYCKALAPGTAHALLGERYTGPAGEKPGSSPGPA